MDKSLTYIKWSCMYHIVWVRKYRRKIMYGEDRLEIGKITRLFYKFKGTEILESVTCIDHIIMRLIIPSKISVSSVKVI